MKNCTPLWREAHLQVKMYKTPGSRNPFGSWAVEKVHASVARSTFRSQNVHTKHTILGPLLEVAMSKKCTPLWREAHFEVKMFKGTTGSDHFWRFRCRFAWQAQGIVHYITLHYTTLHYITLYHITLQLQLRLHNYTPLHSTTLNYTTLHYITVHYIPLHSTTLHYTTLHYTEWHCTTGRQIDR